VPRLIGWNRGIYEFAEFLLEKGFARDTQQSLLSPATSECHRIGFRSLDLQRDRHVFVSLKEAQIFAEDYSI
jgi:hypothetical protein